MNGTAENCIAIAWLFLMVILRPALVVATVWFPNASGLGVAVAGTTAVPFNATTAWFGAVGSVELTVRLPVTVPRFSAAGEKVTVIAHVPPGDTALAQPVAVNGRAVVSTRC